MNNKGFAVSGILYSILALFLMLLLLILSNFHARKVTFDKQKNSVLEKLQGAEYNVGVSNFCYTTDDALQIFTTPLDGTYLLEIYSSNGPGYISAQVKLYQGIILYVTVGSGSDGEIIIKTESDNINTEIMYYNSADNTGAAYGESSIKNDDIAIDFLTNIVTDDTKQQNYCSANSGYVKISRISN